MVVTVSNTSSTATLNTPETVTNGVAGTTYATTATGGSILNPLPFPFNRNGSIAPSGTKALPMHPDCWRRTPVAGLGHVPRDEWNYLVQKGTVTLSTASQAGRRDEEELFINLV